MYFLTIKITILIEITEYTRYFKGVSRLYLFEKLFWVFYNFLKFFLCG